MAVVVTVAVSGGAVAAEVREPAAIAGGAAEDMRREAVAVEVTEAVSGEAVVVEVEAAGVNQEKQKESEMYKEIQW